MPSPLLARVSHALHALSHAAGLDVRRCTACGAPCAPRSTMPAGTQKEESPLCDACADSMQPRKGGYCTRCGLIFADASLPPAPCADCLKTPPPWDSLTFVAVYQKDLRHGMLRFKFHGALEQGAVLGELLAARCLENRAAIGTPDAIVPVPLHRGRLHERGYNQTLELARPVATALGVPLMQHLLRRTAATPHQIGLSKEQRNRNLQGAFAADEAARGKSILLVDDIMTTGATIQAAVRCLRAGGADAVHVAVVGRTPDMIAR
ncbi:MAG: ComF family protein [Halodesulfovibrio sp.]